LPFYNFIKANRDEVVQLNPVMSELEIIAFLNAKWE
jgi:hypothetical protein